MLFTCYLLNFKVYKDSHKFVILKGVIWLTEIRQISADISIGLLDLKSFSSANGLSIKREQEKAGTSFLLRSLTGMPDPDLRYTPEKKPWLGNSSLHVSISHSHDYLAIILDKKKSTGIDIELLRDKVVAVRHKFLNAKESSLAGHDVLKLTTIWAAKEAMYKAHGLKGIDFARDLAVEETGDDLLTGTLQRNDLHRTWHLKKEILGDYVMVYIFEET